MRSSFENGARREQETLLLRRDAESRTRRGMPEKAYAVFAILGPAPEGAAPLKPACLGQNRGQDCVAGLWTVWPKPRLHWARIAGARRKFEPK